MKIAVASNNEMVSEHFGHCKNFNFFEIENGEIISEELVASPGHDCKALPIFLSEHSVDVLIAGGIGRGAINNLKIHNIQVISGAYGVAKEAAINFEAGKLQSTGALCSHDHGHHHHGHSECK